jgi:hypothetical protein
VGSGAGDLAPLPGGASERETEELLARLAARSDQLPAELQPSGEPSKDPGAGGSSSAAPASQLRQRAGGAAKRGVAVGASAPGTAASEATHAAAKAAVLPVDTEPGPWILGRDPAPLDAEDVAGFPAPTKAACLWAACLAAYAVLAASAPLLLPLPALPVVPLLACAHVIAAAAVHYSAVMNAAADVLRFADA